MCFPDIRFRKPWHPWPNRITEIKKGRTMETRNFRGYKAEYNIRGGCSDSYFKALPDHDLGGLVNYLSRLTRHKPIRTCLDIGANIGLASLVMAELIPSGTILSFEPNPATFDYLQTNIGSHNGWAQVSPQPFAVGSKSGTIMFSSDETMTHAAHISVDGTGAEVEQVALDDFLAGVTVGNIDFIKIDVEGFELSVLQGAKNTLMQNRPSILMEFNEYGIVNNAKMDPTDCLKQIMGYLGILAVVDPLTGEATPLSSNPAEAIGILRSMMKSGDDIFDLVNHVV